MGAVYDEFVRELAVWRQKYATRPREEMILLFLLALEREEIVSVAYRASLMDLRLKRMLLPAEVKELIGHALLWAWKDEEMHAIYIRGAILKLGHRLLRFRAFTRQMAGSIGGWATSVQQHVPWSAAPVARTLSTLITGAGALSGQVPRDVQQYLRYGTFRDFCLFNLDAEKTAWLCWNRLAEIARTQTDLPPAMLGDFRKIEQDEERHGQIFETFAAALDEQDRLVPGVTPETLAARIGSVSEFFLPRTLRGGAIAYNPLGNGGPVWVVRGRAVADKLPVFRRLLEDTGLARRLQERARVLGKPVSELRVVIKPALMLGYHRKDLAPITDPVLVVELARWLHEQGCRDIAVVEARNIYDRFFANRTVQEVARYFGIVGPEFRVVDLAEDQVAHDFGRGMAQYTVGHTWKEGNFRITFGKMTSHPVEMVHLTVANLEALGTRCEEYLFSERQAHRDTAIMMLLNDFPPHFALLDAYERASDGIAGMMGSPRPKAPLRFYASADALELDLVAARHMKVRDPLTSEMLCMACHWFGDPRPSTQVIGLDAPIPGWRGPYHNEVSTLLSFLAYPVYQYGSGRGTLFVPEMDEKAFPPLGPVGPVLRLARRGIQSLLGLRLRK